MVDELPSVGAIMVGWRVQVFRDPEVCIDIIAHGRFITHGIDFSVIEERRSTGHISVVCGDVHRCL